MRRELEEDLSDRLHRQTLLEQERQRHFRDRFGGDDLRKLLNKSTGDQKPAESFSRPAPQVVNGAAPLDRDAYAAAKKTIILSREEFEKSAYEDEELARFKWMKDSKEKRKQSISQILAFVVCLAVLIDGRLLGKLTQASINQMTHGGAEYSDSTLHKTAELSLIEPVRTEKPAPAVQAIVPPIVQPREISTDPYALDPADTAARKTTLRSEIPKGTFSRGNVTTLTHVEVRVRNAGSVEAQNIKVTALIPGGASLQLHGPRTLGAGDTATFSAATSQVITVAGNIQMEQTCDNCRK
jgi:uncharacterized repeat protein (TIGR01451 family)